MHLSLDFMNSLWIARPKASQAARRALLGVMTSLVVFLVGSPRMLNGETLELHYRAGAGELVLDSQDARQQLLATSNGTRDVSREVSWSAEPSGIVRLDTTGRVIPVADGAAVISAKSRDGVTARLPVRVVQAGQPAPLHFANQIVPIFTKNGCNGGGCHGKAAGQNGFRLSLLGFEPDEDYEH